MNEAPDEESVHEFFDNEKNADVVESINEFSEDADIITVFLSEADTLKAENVEVEDILPKRTDGSKVELAVSEFVQRTCGCSERCSSKFALNVIAQSRNHFLAFDCDKHGRNQLDTVLLGIIQAITLSDTVPKRGSNLMGERQRLKPVYLFHGMEVCEEFFVFVHGIEIKRLRNLLARYKQNHNAIRELINSNHEKSSNAVLPHEHLVNFLRNFAEDHALYFPRRVSSQKRIIKLLPSDVTKTSVYAKYKSAAEQMNDTPVDVYKFSDVWITLCPDIIIQKLQSDSKRAQRKRLKKQLTLRQKEDMEVLKKRESLLRHIQPEINYYHSVTTETRNSFPFSKFDVPKPVQSFDGCVHLSFDLAQQVHIPSNPQKPNPMYFLVPYKVTIFGVLNETCRRQCNYIIPEAATFSKERAPNCVISYLHHYLQQFTFGETELHLHGGDCMARCKNSLLMQYLAWRVARKLNRKITVSFLPANFTKFGPDYGFGFFKMKFRESVANCLGDVASIVDASTPNSGLNFSFLVANESGELFVEIFDWRAAFGGANWRGIAGIGRYSHFCFDETWPGRVKCREFVDEETSSHEIFDSTLDVSGISFGKLECEGLSQQRRLYLYEKIRPYCVDSIKDALCPFPQTEAKPKGAKKRKLKSDR